LVKSTTIISRKVTRSPNSSRMRSARPFPVTVPIREHISCTTTSATVTGRRIHNSP